MYILFGILLVFMSVKISGFDNVIKKLNDLETNVKKLEGKHEIPLAELLNIDFMEEHTNFETAEDFINSCKTVCGDDFLEIDETDEKFIEFIKENTIFNSWAEMKDKAFEKWIKNKIHF